jgi:hypothetical protein
VTTNDGTVGAGGTDIDGDMRYWKNVHVRYMCVLSDDGSSRVSLIQRYE